MRTRFRLTPYGRLWRAMLVLVVAGWLVLMLPGMAAKSPLTWLDCLFTSTSAVCVTGLTVRSTGNDFTFLGQVVILTLIQIGGLGFMTLSSSLLMHLRRKATLGDTALIGESLGSESAEKLPNLLLRCLRLVMLIEAVGVLLLFPRFSMEIPEGSTWWGHAPVAAWQAVFHSISSFCNAGFSTWDSSLAAFVNDVWTNAVVCALIVLGGLGFFVLADVEQWLRSRRTRLRTRLQFQSQLVLFTTLCLIIGGAILIWLGERVNTEALEGASVSKGWMVSVFQSVTARTAGFFTVEVKSFTSFSVAVTILLMFIGASPGSCGGGVKTTTFAVVATMALGSLRAGREPTFRKRAFSSVTVRSAISLLFAAAGLVIAGSLFLMLLGFRGDPGGQLHANFVSLVFEAASAFGTVGLSTGITPSLTVAGKLCLITLMFLGRVGPLGLISASLRGGARPQVEFLHEDVQIG